MELKPTEFDSMTIADAPVRIVADDRERAGGVIAHLRQRDDVLLAVDRLGVGDFWIEDDFVVERKTIRDFAISLVDGRWFKQCSAMAAGPRRGVVVLEGTMSEAADLQITRDSLQGALITISVFFGVAVVRALDVRETSRLLVYLGRQARRSAHGMLHRPGYRPKGKRARQSFILQGLPGVGPERANILLTHFGSVERVVVASAAELAAVEGIGDKTATRIRWAVK
jgi:ERCC4-type nuclease